MHSTCSLPLADGGMAEQVDWSRGLQVDRPLASGGIQVHKHCAFKQCVLVALQGPGNEVAGRWG